MERKVQPNMPQLRSGLNDRMDVFSSSYRIRARASRRALIPVCMRTSDFSLSLHSSNTISMASRPSRTISIRPMTGGPPEERSKSRSARRRSRNDTEHQAQSRQPAPLAGKTVVVVEDEGITIMQLRRTLTQVGLKVVGVAGNGEDGVTV